MSDITHIEVFLVASNKRFYQEAIELMEDRDETFIYLKCFAAVAKL